MIREATHADVPRLVEMGRRFLDETNYGADTPFNAAQLAQFAQWLIDHDGVIFVVERDGVIVGMLGAMQYHHPMSGASTVAEMFWWVEPEARGDGVRLVKRVEAWARDRQAMQIILTAPTARVGRLYDRLGYHATETSYVRSMSCLRA